jgi:hypothetical protein
MAAQRARQGVAAARFSGVTTIFPPFHLPTIKEKLDEKTKYRISS